MWSTKLPKHNGPSMQYQKQDIHGINVIAAGKGVMTPLAFQGSARSHPVHRQGWDFEAKRLEKWVPRLWICGQTRLGLADVLTPRRGVCLGGLTVVDLGELVEKFEEDDQHALRRLAGLLAKLRDTVRALGSTCVVSISALPPGDPGCASGPTQRHSFDIHSSAKEVPILKDWHKEHFWSQDETIHARNWPSKSVIRKVVT
ncbi:hypothetical protein UCDDA912_g01034 [Diaporthe ampelina]|uniref:Uncharacterized protein n=1 Tax=Diaporthe ampelina TaxID=1214573 RepID=A0A0G2FXY2_9PEZI|nr:hypothetical protein UCDDA912_g01034 [Diaporthe ampelina]